MANHGNVILSFEKVNFNYGESRQILLDVEFTVRENAKITIMGQNGAGKSTIFKLILGATSLHTDLGEGMTLKPDSGKVNIPPGKTVAIALQVMPKHFFDHTVTEYFETAFPEKIYHLEKLIKDVLEVVNLSTPLDKKIKEFSGGQLARLLLAYALIQEPDILLLDEPTNNLDAEGIGHLTGFLMSYEKTVIVISHDAGFLNCFTDGVLNLDIYTKTVDQYVGDYFDVVEQIANKVEADQRKNAQLRKNIQDRKDKINFFANKGGKMRRLASKLRDEVAEDEDSMVEVRRDDRTIKPFTIPCQEWSNAVAKISSVGVIVNHERVLKPIGLKVFCRNKILLQGPNGIGKSTFLRDLALTDSSEAAIVDGARVGYYQQDFSGLNFDQTVYESLAEVADDVTNEKIYATGAHFLLTSDLMRNKVGSLSEGQKGLLCYARFVLQRPALLILDEPTNHINFRHIPLIAQAIDEFTGAVILVSHMDEFVHEISFTDTLDLGALSK